MSEVRENVELEKGGGSLEGNDRVWDAELVVEG